MSNNLQNKIKKYIEAINKKRKWVALVLALCLLVASVTAYVLINPAATQSVEAFCGQEEHTEHSDECYKVTKTLQCSLTEEGHTHTDECYELKLTCGKEESEGQHTDECYSDQQVLICDNTEEDHEHTDECYAWESVLVCENPEHEAHQHDESCYTEKLVCEQEEAEPHIHNDDCYVTEKTLVCEKEIHQHSLQCFSNPLADLEDSSIWERDFDDVKLTGVWSDDVVTIAKTQMGYTESTANYIVQEDGVSIKGYSRYGDWFGLPYENWCGMFCSFCMHYAGVDSEKIPFSAGCWTWIDELKKPELDLYRETGTYIPKPGDLVFFDWDSFDPEYPEYRESDHVGLVAEIVYDKKTNEPKQIKTIEGNYSECVCSNTYDLTDSVIEGYGIMPENPALMDRTIESKPASDGAVAVITGVFPENAVAEIEAIVLSEEELVSYFGEERAELMTGYVAYDIKIMVDGVEWQPDKTVSVKVRHPELSAEKNEGFAVAHVNSETSEIADVTAEIDKNGDIIFEADGFSLYIFYTFTVDFHYGEFSFSIAGMDSVLLSDLFRELDIDRSVREVTAVTFTDPALLTIEKVEGDWRLTSLQAFSTAEALTITFEDGTGILIDVTDAQLAKDDIWKIVTSIDEFEEGGVYAILSGTTNAFGANGTSAMRTVVARSGNNTDGYTLTTSNGQAGLPESSQWEIIKTGTNTVTVQNIGNGNYLRLNNSTFLGASANTTVSSSGTGNSTTWTLKSNSSTYYLRLNSSNNFVRDSSSGNMTIYRLVPKDNVWVYHSNNTSEPYAKYATLHDATVRNSDLRDGDVIELHGNTKETKQTVIQKSITVKSETGKNYTINYNPVNNYLEYGIVYCDTKADGNRTEYVETETGKYYYSTRDCITVSPEEFGTELEVLFKDVTIDGYEATWKDGDLWDYHILQAIHDVELTLSNVTIQNFDIMSNLQSNGAISLDGRSTYVAPTDTEPASYGTKLILTDDTLMQGCDGFTSHTDYSTGGIMLNSAYLEMNDSTIKDCNSRRGSAVCVDSHSTMCMNDGAVIENAHAELQGSAIRNSGTVYLNEGSIIRNCTPKTGSTTLQGGAVYNSGGEVYVSGGLISECTAAKGGAIYNRKGIVDISGGTISGCSADEGGAIYNDDGDLFVSGGTMSGNSADGDSKNYGDTEATLGSGIYQDGMMYLSGSPTYSADQDVYLPEDRVITKNGEISPMSPVSVVLENEPRYRDILVSQDLEDCVVDSADLQQLNVKLSASAVVDVEGKSKPLGAVYNAEGLDSEEDPANVVELDLSDKIVVKKIWNELEGETPTHESITVYLYEEGVTEPIKSLTLGEGNGWTGTFTELEINDEGHIPYYVREAEVEDYTSSASDVHFVEGEKPVYWVPASTNAFSNGEFVIYGNSLVLSHNENTLTSTSLTPTTDKPITVNNTSYESYFKESQIKDNMIWLATGSSTYLTTKAIEGQSQYQLLRSGSTSSSNTISLTGTGSNNWNISGGKVRQGTNGGYTYLNLSNPTSTSNSGTTVQLYTAVEGDAFPGHYEVTITNTAKRYEDLLVRKEWIDRTDEHRPESIRVEVRDGKGHIYKTLTLSDENNWQETVEHLLVSEDGKLDYSIREIVPEGLDEWYITETGSVEYVSDEYWLPATSNQFTAGTDYLLYSNGYVIERNGTNAIKTTAVSLGATVDGVSQPNYISGDAVKGILGTAVWSAVSTGTYGNNTAIKNGNYYLVYNGSNPGYQLSTTAGTVTMDSGKLRLYSGSNNSYLSITNTGALPTQRITNSGSANAFVLYQKVDDASTSGHFEAVITNREIEYTSLLVNKVWSDGNEKHNGQTAKITLHSSYGEDPVSAVLSQDNDWSYEFKHLIVPAEGESFGYTVTEDRVEGYTSIVSDAKFVRGSEGTVWGQVNAISGGKEYLLVSEGSMVRHTGTNASIGVASVEVGDAVVVNGRSYASSISDADVTDADIWTATSGWNSFTLQNGGYYICNATTPISTTSSNLSLTSAGNNTGLYRINLGQANSNTYYLRINGSTVTRSNGTAYASSFAIYEKNGDGEPAPDSYSMTITNQKLSVGEADPVGVLKKQIDYLGDDGNNTDTSQSGEDLYRLYLQSSADSTPVDLLIIADVSNSMQTQNAGTNETIKRFQVLDRILNGKVSGSGNEYATTNNAASANRDGDGLIYTFLNDNPENRVGVIGFANTAEIRTPTKTSQNNVTWVSKSDIKNGSTTPKDYYASVTLSPLNSNTNYIAGFVDAEELLMRGRNSDNKLVVIFLTDGLPDGISYKNAGGQDITTAATNSANLFDAIFSGSYYGYNKNNGSINTSGTSYDYSDSLVYVVGIGSEAGTGEGQRILTNIASTVNTTPYISTSSDQLKAALSDIVDAFRTRVVLIQDELSEYVNFAANPDIKITMRDPENPPGTGEVAIYENGRTTLANTQNGKPIIESVSIIGKEIKVKFADDYKIDPRKVFTVSYNIQRIEYTDETAPHTGDDETDYMDNETSSGQPGFNSNKSAHALYTVGNDYYEGIYDHPVVQIPFRVIEPIKPDPVTPPEYNDTATIGKQIDYLGDSLDGNGNIIPGMDELYRLYLNLEADSQPIDLLLVIDQSGSMANTLAGGKADDTSSDASKHSRQKVMLDFLNGTEQSDGSYDGFIARFLASNNENDLAILTFDNDSSLDETKRYIHKWGDDTDHIENDLTPNGATNFTAAYWAANEIWKLEETKEAEEALLQGDDYREPIKMMIFLSDGEPTYAYSDGVMQRGLAQSTVVGNGGEATKQSGLPLELVVFMNWFKSDITEGGDYWRNRQLYDGGRAASIDDDGAKCSTYRNCISSNTDDRVRFPVVCKITGMKVNVPGISNWPLGEINADVFVPWYDEIVAPVMETGVVSEAYQEWVDEGIKSVGDTYDLFWLSEWAFHDFAEENYDVLTYTVGFSQETDGKFGEAPSEGEEDTRRERAEVLKYMSGDMDEDGNPLANDDCQRFIQCNSADALAEAINSVAVGSIHMSDTLSDYVDFSAEPNLEITISDERYESLYEKGKDYAYLYKDGDFTTLGESLLDTSATEINTDDKTVDIVFKPGVAYDDHLKVEASFTVKLTEQAYEDKDSTGYTDTGDPLTDYDTTHPTSSEKDGFYSNDEAKAQWTQGGSHERDFPKPVVQVPDPVDILLKKVDAGGDFAALAGAEFDLYFETSSNKTGCISYTGDDGTTHYLLKINENPLISTKNNAIEVEGIRVGHYYLFEKTAPAGYNCLEKPVQFDVSTSTLLTEDENAEVGESNSLLLNIKNRSGYVLPKTGGTGTFLFTLCGVALMGTALMVGFNLRRKRERREKG